LYNRDGDVLYATGILLAVHTVAGGDRTFRLPRQGEEVYDLFARNIVGRDTREFRVTLPPSSTALYYTGDATLLTKLKHMEVPG
jgi:hypothetical protein